MTNKVYVLAPREDWIVDRFVNEWNADNDDISVGSPAQADVIWLMADWCFDQLNPQLLASKKVITTIHHIVPEKFKVFDAESKELARFVARDKLTTVYHVPNRHTEAFIRPLTSKPIHVIPYWANNHIWRPTGTKGDIRKKYGLSETEYLVGSFQRDTEGSSILLGPNEFLPKIEKGPKEFVQYVVKLSQQRSNVAVLLAGWRRHYVIQQLTQAKRQGSQFQLYIDVGECPRRGNFEPFNDVEFGKPTWIKTPTPKDLPSQIMLNEYYQCLDLYPVTAWHEGGPQSLIEAGLLGVPVVSRDIGIASQVLPSSAIADDVSTAIPTIPHVEHLKLPLGYLPYRELIQSL